jgi:hypothetical protein
LSILLVINLFISKDEALKETIFELDDDPGNKRSKKKRGEVLRAKALTERKLAICRSAIEKNSRSIKLGQITVYCRINYRSFLCSLIFTVPVLFLD